jgi:EmrB/QacA subfamily drug resistance transporter
MDSRKRNIVIAIMVAMFLAAIEGTVVTTAVPTIVRVLDGFELISWVFSLYLLASAIATPIYGKLSDLYGRGNTLSAGIVIFLIGSTLCGLSRNMYQLIIFRVIQGLGAGAVFTVTYTIVGDVFSLEERAKVQGWLSSVWGIASLAGPFFGGFLIDTLSWNWIFFINIPFGILSIILLQRNLKESFEKKRHKMDFAGTFFLSAAILVLLYGILSGGRAGRTIILTAVLLMIFYFIEKKAEEPIIPFEVFTRGNTAVNIICFLLAAILIGADVYMPIYVQNVLGYGAAISGLSLSPLSIAWILSTVILSKGIPKYGERVITVLSVLILLLSCGLLLLLNLKSSLMQVVIYSFIMGFGFGGALPTLTIAVQASVGYDKRGAVTASNSLLRTLGQTIGVSVFGGLFNSRIIKYFAGIGISGIEPDNLYSASALSTGVTAEHIRVSINSGLHVIFAVFVLLAVLSLVLSLTLGSGLRENAAGD